MVNNVVLIGRLTRDPELRTSESGTTLAKFGIAVNKRFKPKDGSADADFFNVTAFNKTAEFVGNYLTKGRMVAITGRIETRKYTDKDGNNREAVDIIAETVNGLDRPREDEGGGGGQRAGARMGGAAPAEDEIDPFDVD